MSIGTYLSRVITTVDLDVPTTNQGNEVTRLQVLLDIALCNDNLIEL